MRMSKNVLLLTILALMLFAILIVPGTFALDFPTRPITMVIPFSAGGGSDNIARAFIAVAPEHLGVRIIPHILPGASGAIATDHVYKAEPDGYTLLFGAPHMTHMFPHMQKVDYDPLKLVPVCKINETISILCTPGDRPWKDWEGFVEYAKAHPNELAYASTGTYGFTHVRWEGILSQLGLKLRHIPYDGGAESTIATIRGEVDFGGGSMSHGLGPAAAGQMIPMAIVGPSRLPQMPDVPTLEELGVDPLFRFWRTIFAPPGTPKEVVDIIAAKFKEICEDPSFVSLMDLMGEPIAYQTGEEFQKFYEEEYYRTGKIIESLGMKNE